MSNEKMVNVTTFPAVVGAILRHYRTTKGIEQKDLSEKTGIPQSTISRAEKGDVSVSVDLLDKLCYGLGVMPSQVFKDAETARTNLLKNDVEIRSDAKTSDLIKKGLVVVGIAAIIALIARR